MMLEFADQASLAVAARVCQQWSAIARDELWKSLPSIFPLLKLVTFRKWVLSPTKYHKVGLTGRAVFYVSAYNISLRTFYYLWPRQIGVDSRNTLAESDLWMPGTRGEQICLWTLQHCSKCLDRRPSYELFGIPFAL